MFATFTYLVHLTIYGYFLSTHSMIFLAGFFWILITYISRQSRSKKYTKLVEEGEIGKDWTLDSNIPVLMAIPILDEPIEYYKDVLKKLNQSIKFAKLTNYHAVIVFDGVDQDWSKKEQKRILGELYEVTAQYDFISIAAGEQEEKRPNVTWAQEYVVKNAEKFYPHFFAHHKGATIDDFIDAIAYMPMDSDTKISENTIAEVLKPLSQGTIGSTTCVQKIGNPQGIIQRIDAWMEDSRGHEGAMRALNLDSHYGFVSTGLMFGALICLAIVIAGYFVTGIITGIIVWLAVSLFLRERQSSTGPQIICNPGRLSVYRLRPIWDRRERFLHDPCFFSGTDRGAGDDRKHTNDIREANLDVTMVITSELETTAVDTFRKWVRQKKRWRRTGNGYTIQDSPGLSRYPKAFGTAWNDIFIMLWTNYVALHWFYIIFFGSSDQGWWIVIELLLSYIGMICTMLIRQYGHLKRHPEDWKLLFVFPFFATLLQLIGGWVLFSLCNMDWGHRTQRNAKGKRMPLSDMRYSVLKP